MVLTHYVGVYYGISNICAAAPGLHTGMPFPVFGQSWALLNQNLTALNINRLTGLQNLTALNVNWLTGFQNLTAFNINC